MREDVWAEFKKERDREKAALQAVEQAIRTANRELFGHGLAAVDSSFIWRRALLRVTRRAAVPDEIRQYFLECWLRYGDHIRQEVGDDHLLIRSLRVLLPPYTGPAVLLYRGESWTNRRRRTYGPYWSANREVGEAYAATGHIRTSHGGSVLLRTLAPPAAIICAPLLECEDRYAEQEYIVDRSRLNGVEVLQHYSQVTFAEQQTLAGGAPG